MKKYSLTNKESSGFVKIMQIIFGILCIGTSVWWTVFMLSAEVSGNYWAAILFMLFFGAFQIYSGLGYADRFLLIDEGSITIKATALSRAKTIKHTEIESIEILPLTFSIFLKNGNKVFIRFGITLSDGIDSVKDALQEFAAQYEINADEKSDMI
jgi:hypothetical protein